MKTNLIWCQKYDDDYDDDDYDNDDDNYVDDGATDDDDDNNVDDGADDDDDDDNTDMPLLLQYIISYTITAITTTAIYYQ